MTSKEYLNQYRRITTLIERKKEQIEDIEDQLTSIGISFDERVQTSGINDLSGSVGKLVDLKADLYKDIVKKTVILKEIILTIDKIEEPELIDVLYKRYLQFKTWVVIAYEMNISYQWVHELHGKALNKVSYLIEVYTEEVI